MTSLVVVMNNRAAAVAADSAMKTTWDDRQRNRLGVRKIFQLNNRLPISVMTHRSADIMNMAWGPIFVSYRQQYGNKLFATVEDCAEHFLSFLDDYKDFFTDAVQTRSYLDYVEALFDWVRTNVNEIVRRENEEPSDSGPTTMRDVMRLATDLVYEDIMTTPNDEPRADLPGFDGTFARDLQRKYAADVQLLIDQYFAEGEPDKETIRRLREMAALAVTKDFFPDFFEPSGLVFTGYGERQITPQMVAYLVGFAVNGKLRKRLSNVKSISSDDPVIIAPFADDRMLHTFLTGMDEDLQDYVTDQIIDLAVAIRDRTIAQLPQMTRTQRQRFSQSYSDDEIVDLINEFLSRLDNFQYAQHTHPILLAIESLPEKDLATTAEMFVKLNAFQHHVSLDLATVGGDIDVALMTNESFRWIKNSKD